MNQMILEHRPQITRRTVLSMQVCVPESFTDTEVKNFADFSNECGTENGWMIRRSGDKLLDGAEERVPCSERHGCVHVMVDA